MAIGRTPRELLAQVTSEDITEMMAFERLEPFGALHLEFLAGQVCATLANINRDPKQRAEAWQARDFMPALDRNLQRHERAQGPVFIDDPEAMSALIKERIFKVAPHAG